ncbi:MAG: phenylacetate--CoA ligase family protein [Pirellulaceae bacterium]|nr:phenylacetate--CoA ligase family protein [Pirellulaceae bacterium]
MLGTTFDRRRELERMSGNELKRFQLDRLNRLLATILPQNRFYAEKLAGMRLPLASLEEVAGLPMTGKDELGQTGQGDLAANHTYPRDQYVRFHRTSGTRGRPLVILDTADDWQWWVDTWQFVLDAADLGPADRVLTAFSFGPFIGFWTAHDAAVARGALVIPGGGLNTLARLELIQSSQATTLLCTPSYALHLAEAAVEHGIDTRGLEVRKIIVAGEPGGSVAAIRDRIEAAWNARVIDHAGATEVGPWGYADRARRGLHVVESEFIAEFLAVPTGRPAGDGELAELILTGLNRSGCPVIRYRTGDLVRPTWRAAGENRFVLLKGGVLGRADDMLVIRGMNIFPSSVEQILRSFPEIAEYRMIADRVAEMDALTIEVEDRLDEPARIGRELQVRLGLRIDVRCVPLGSLPRFEGKGRRFVDRRPAIARGLRKREH